MLDLAALGEDLTELVGDARVVMLGEATHGDGAGMVAMSELVRLLHLEHGFSRLIFESPAWSVDRAWDAFIAGEDARSAAGVGVYPMWAKSAEMQGLWQHIAAHAHGSSPLRLEGMDCRLTGRAAIGLLLAALGDPEDGAETVDAAMTGSAGARARIASWPASANEGARMAIRALLDWSQAVDAMEADPTDVVAYSARDVWMGEEVLRLARESADRLVVWAASFHALGASTVIEGFTGDGVPHAAMTRTGDVVRAGLGPGSVRTIALTSATGSFGLPWWDQPVAIEPPPVGSFEAVASATYQQPRLVAPPAGRTSARPFGYSDVTARWSEVVDAFLFVPVMTPATRSLPAPLAP